MIDHGNGANNNDTKNINNENNSDGRRFPRAFGHNSHQTQYVSMLIKSHCFSRGNTYLFFRANFFFSKSKNHHFLFPFLETNQLPVHYMLASYYLLDDICHLLKQFKPTSDVTNKCFIPRR